MLCSLFTFCSVLKSQPPKWLYQLLLPQIVGTLTSHMLFGHNVTFPAADYLYSRWNWVSSKVWSQSVQSLSRVRLFSRVRPHELQHARLLCPSTTPRACSNSSIESVMPSNCLILCCPLPLPPSVFASIRVFSSESVLHIKWPKYWSFSFSISPSNEYSGLFSIGIDWLDLLAVQGTLKSLLQHHSSKASILWCSAFFIVQLSRL